jgi:hypothetical protein
MTLLTTRKYAFLQLFICQGEPCNVRSYSPGALMYEKKLNKIFITFVTLNSITELYLHFKNSLRICIRNAELLAPEFAFSGFPNGP